MRWKVKPKAGFSLYLTRSVEYFGAPGIRSMLAAPGVAATDAVLEVLAAQNSKISAMLGVAARLRGSA